MDLTTKGRALLHFLKEATNLRRPRMPEYRSEDRVLWFSDIPNDCREIRSPILTPPTSNMPDFWFEVEKTPQPKCPSLSRELTDWVRPEDLDSPHTEPELNKVITVLVEKKIPDPDGPSEEPRFIKKKVPEIRRLEDHPEIEDAWIEYFVNHWEPWAEKRRYWEKVSSIYEEVDFMRRRLEEAEERFELYLGLGLLQWRDSNNVTIKRHLLMGPAEIMFNASRGIITVLPAASFETFKPELDMLDFADRPRLEGTSVQEMLEDLDTQAWDKKKVGKILREIANRAQSGAQVEEEGFKPARTADNTLRVTFAPALILRERRPTAFEEVVTRLLDDFSISSEDTSLPWKLFLAEGRLGSKNKSLPSDPEKKLLVDHEYFPLPTNPEQRQIIQRLQHSPAVVVKGPPGTGKSHTIANLICHLLAMGEKVLITAQALKALTVLRDMLPKDLRDLCLISLGSAREDQQQLESGVKTIIGRKNLWDQDGHAQAEERIKGLEKDLRLLKENLSQVELKLRESREAETYPHILPGRYEGTTAQIAQRLEKEKEEFYWFSDTLYDDPDFPFGQAEVKLLAEMHAKLTPEYESELRYHIGDFTLPSSEDFRRILGELKIAESRASQAQAKIDPAKIPSFIQTSPNDFLEKILKGLRLLNEQTVRAEHVLGNMTEEIIKDLLIGKDLHLKQLLKEAQEISDKIENLFEEFGRNQITIPADLDPIQVQNDATRRLRYLEGGHWQGFWFIKPKILRETQYLESCLVNGQPVCDHENLRKLVAYFNVKAYLESLNQLLPQLTENSDIRKDIFLIYINANQNLSALRDFIDFVDNLSAALFSQIPSVERMELAYPSGRWSWIWAIEEELARRTALALRQNLEECRQKIQNCLDSGKAHPCLAQLAEALQKEDPASWEEAIARRDAIRIPKVQYQQYKKLLAQLEQTCPSLTSLIRSHQGNPQWQARLVNLERAWYWATARGWLEKVVKREEYEELLQKHDRLKKQIEKRTEELASERAWQAFFRRLDDFTIQNLNAWTSTVHRIGKGTGKFASQHRRQARRYLMACIPQIPAWIMPLHKLWDTIEATPSLFDTVIIDEASQAELSALVLLLLAKRIIVVGDKMQNSPEAVGIKEEDITRLALEQLKDFHFRAEFRPDTSLFDHAERGFGNLISLREHFRCVPEIIRFSNDLCYREAPLIPLRQPPVDRLPPLKHTFVPGGYCEGDGQRIHNEAEADQLVQTILQCLEDKTYEGKSMGVIVLQGRAQADLIERKLAAALPPHIIAERKLRCGVPATFQGDQRDVIFLSLVISPERQFRALTGLDFVRRYNVAMSRARDQVWLFNSVKQSDLRPDCLRRKLLQFFESPWQLPGEWESEQLERLEREAARSPRRPREQPEPYESWFEVDVALELIRRKYQVLPQFEVAGYRIDLVVEGSESRLAVECDGEAWHGRERYEYDMARQRQLERAGWIFVRIRESEFYLDRDRAVGEIIQACDDLGILPLDMELKPVEEKISEAELALDVSPEPEYEPMEEAELPDEPFPVTGPFTGYEEMDFPDPREAPISNICTAIKEILAKDGPLTRSSLYYLYVEGCLHIQRAGRAVREKINYALRTLVKAGEIVREDELGRSQPEGIVLRLPDTPPVRIRPAGRRKLEEIPPSEIFLVMDRLGTTTSDPQAEEALFRAILDYFGFKQLTRTRKKHLQNIFEHYKKKEQKV